ncbi:unnamed protein product [Mytilus edulis]|uniref:Uncharacterized protein n=1 Tax=Mytilus edulis TaxID=6550 RepID=A0A8S3TS16_MYTED|nr:unnamed protein product [Mytilus edulis]
MMKPLVLANRLKPYKDPRDYRPQADNQSDPRIDKKIDTKMNQTHQVRRRESHSRCQASPQQRHVVPRCPDIILPTRTVGELSKREEANQHHVINLETIKDNSNTNINKVRRRESHPRCQASPQQRHVVPRCPDIILPTRTVGELSKREEANQHHVINLETIKDNSNTNINK